MRVAKSRHGHSILVRLALLAFAGYLIVSMWDVHTELTEKRRELADTKATLETVTLQNEELTNLLRNGSDKDIIERAARDRLGYVYKDEIVFKQKR